jgi:hypothetical protein
MGPWFSQNGQPTVIIFRPSGKPVLSLMDWHHPTKYNLPFCNIQTIINITCFFQPKKAEGFGQFGQNRASF